MQLNPARHDDIVFYARRFMDSRYRGRAHLRSDLRRFAAVYRIPNAQRPEVEHLVDRLLATA